MNKVICFYFGETALYFSYGSTLVMLSLAIDRFLAIGYPLWLKSLKFLIISFAKKKHFFCNFRYKGINTKLYYIVMLSFPYLKAAILQSFNFYENSVIKEINYNKSVSIIINF